jgi:NADH:ubiquinone oxidoreductase subunit 6 (subunit J)
MFAIGAVMFVIASLLMHLGVVDMSKDTDEAQLIASLVWTTGIVLMAASLVVVAWEKLP